MIRKCKVLVGAFVAALGLAVPQTQAALVDRGGGMLYDDVLNVTWLQDANYANTSGYCGVAGNCAASSGQMNWTQANRWANGLEYGGYSDWRLAKNSPVNGVRHTYTFSASGLKDVGYNITSPFSEQSYMYYVNLGLKGYFSVDGDYQSDFGVFRNGTTGGQKDVGLVQNLQADVYWSGTYYSPSSAEAAWGFNAGSGSQAYYLQTSGNFAWAVRDGNVTVAAVPVPGSVALLAGGLALLGVVTRRRGRLGASEA